MNGPRALRYWAALTVAVALTAGGALFAVQHRFGWLELWHRADDPDPVAAPAPERPADEPVRVEPPPAVAVVNDTVAAAVTAATAGAAEVTVIDGAAVGSTGPGVCTAAVDGAVARAAAKVTAAASDTVAVSAAAVGPGLGPGTLDSLRGQLRGCRGTRLTSVAVGAVGPDSGAFRATTAGTTTTVFRRGDVVVSVLSVGAANMFTVYGNPPEPARHTAIVDAADAALSAALAGVCLDESGTVDGPSRNPYSGAPFTGLTVTRTVTADQLPEPPPTTPPTSTSTSLPDGTVAALDEWVVALRGVESLAELTAPPVPRPRWQRYPARPDPVPHSRSYQVRVADDEGPGCGWEFTSTVPPAVDRAELNEAAAQAKELHLAALAEDREAAFAAEAVYDDELASYELYAQRRRAWELYDDALRRLTPPPPTTTTTTSVPPPTTTTTTTTPPSTTTTAPPTTTTDPTTTTTTTTP